MVTMVFRMVYLFLGTNTQINPQNAKNKLKKKTKSSGLFLRVEGLGVEVVSEKAAGAA